MGATTSQITICNSALLKLGADMITDLSENSRAANVCNALYQYIRDEVMGSSRWRFALKQAVIAPNNTVPLFQYQSAYNIPNDCLRPLGLQNDEIEWMQYGSLIYANVLSTAAPNLNLEYLFQNTDETTWDNRFCESFAWRLAMELAMALTESIPKKDACEKSYKDSLAQARALNAIIGTIPGLEADIWSRARKGYRSQWRTSQGQVGNP